MKTPWTRQPQFPVGIDWGNSITRGLVFAFEASIGKRDLVSGAAGGNIGSGVTRAVGPSGIKYNFSGSQASGAFDFGVHHGMDGATGCTFDILVNFNASNPNTHFFGQWDGSYQQWLLQANGSGGLVWVPADGNGTGATRTRFDGSGLFSTAGYYRIIASWRGGTDKTVLVNGVDKTSSFSTVSSTATAIGTDNVSDKLQIGMVFGGTALNGGVHFARCWRRGMTKSECFSLHDRAWQIFAPLERRFPLLAGSPPQLLVPISDVSAGGWTPSTGSDLYAMLDESAASDSDYIVSASPSSCEMRITVGTDPALSTGHVLRYRLLSGTGSVSAALKQGSTTIASFGPHTLTGSAQDFAQTLSSGEADSITDYSDLRVVFTAS